MGLVWQVRLDPGAQIRPLEICLFLFLNALLPVGISLSEIVSMSGQRASSSSRLSFILPLSPSHFSVSPRWLLIR